MEGGGGEGGGGRKIQFDPLLVHRGEEKVVGKRERRDD